MTGSNASTKNRCIRGEGGNFRESDRRAIDLLATCLNSVVLNFRYFRSESLFKGIKCGISEKNSLKLLGRDKSIKRCVISKRDINNLHLTIFNIVLFLRRIYDEPLFFFFFLFFFLLYPIYGIHPPPSTTLCSPIDSRTSNSIFNNRADSR